MVPWAVRKEARASVPEDQKEARKEKDSPECLPVGRKYERKKNIIYGKQVQVTEGEGDPSVDGWWWWWWWWRQRQRLTRGTTLSSLVSDTFHIFELKHSGVRVTLPRTSSVIQRHPINAQVPAAALYAAVFTTTTKK